MKSEDGGARKFDLKNVYWFIKFLLTYIILSTNIPLGVSLRNELYTEWTLADTTLWAFMEWNLKRGRVASRRKKMVSTCGILKGNNE